MATEAAMLGGILPVKFITGPAMSGERHVLFTPWKRLPATIPATRGAGPLGGEDRRKQDYASLIVVGLPAKLEMPRADNATRRKQAPAPLDSTSVQIADDLVRVVSGRKRVYQD